MKDNEYLITMVGAWRCTTFIIFSTVRFEIELMLYHYSALSFETIIAILIRSLIKLKTTCKIFITQ